VYQYLFEGIADELSDVITVAIAAAWTEVYWLMAHALITLEDGLYAGLASDQALTPRTVTAKVAAGSEAVTFTLVPADDTPVSKSRPGQYVGVSVVMTDGISQVRQYSLSTGTGTDVRVFTTKLDTAGEVSPALHREVHVGDTPILSHPCGDVTLADGDGPLILASAGIGCTPSASIFRALADQNSKRQVTVLHAESTVDRWALREQMSEDIDHLNFAALELWLESPLLGTDDGAHPGYLSRDDVVIATDATIYLCGPLPAALCPLPSARCPLCAPSAPRPSREACRRPTSTTKSSAPICGSPRPDCYLFMADISFWRRSLLVELSAWIRCVHDFRRQARSGQHRG